MKTLLILIAAVLPYWQDMQVTSVGAETRRTEVVFYKERQDALRKSFRESENYLSLNGTWDFKYYEDLVTAPESPASWDSILVPGNWEVQGWGIPIYTNIPYDFCPSDPQPPELPSAIPGAFYRRRFTVPENWAGREVYLNLCGTKSGTYVYVNGQALGYHEDSKSLARYRITDALHKGDNELVLKIFRYTTASFLEDQDFWRLSGIERDVYLSSEAGATGFDFSVTSTLTEDLQTGIFQLELRSEAPAEVYYELIDPEGKIVADALYNVRGSQTTLPDRIAGVRPWSAETPVLYTLLLRVNGEFTRFKVGFRRLEIAPVMDGEKEVKAFLVNGQPVKFKGVNYHEHNPFTGHYLTRENLLEDLLLMKEANVNAIRTCHYPQGREFYELCDSLGFYVYDEANIESHAMGYRPQQTLGNRAEWWPKHQDRILNMYRRTANYPCVTLLSLGNEAGNGVNFHEAYRLLKALEKDGQNRPVVYERAEMDWNTDMIVPQYPGADWLRHMGESYFKRPVCPSEYAHAMGNSTGSLDRQWEAIYAHTQLQGGFIWDWVDQGLYDAEKGFTYGGDYGTDVPSDANFLCNGIVNPDRQPHPAFYEVKQVYQEVSVRATDLEEGVFEVFNRHYFKSLDGYTLRWWIERDGKRIRRGKLQLHTAPQTAETIRIRLPRMRRRGEYRLFFETATPATSFFGKGRVVAVDEILLKEASEPGKRRVRGRLEFTESATRIRVHGSKVDLVFDKEEGFVRSWMLREKDLVEPTFGIRPNFWRPPTDNDYGNGEPLRSQRYKQPARPASVSAQSLENGAVAISVQGSGVRASEIWTIFPDGTLEITVETAPEKDKDVEIPRLGFRFRVKDNNFRYFGRGPVENYQDRCSASFKRIWSSSATAEFFPYVRPQETGHHTGTDWLSIGPITVARADEPFEFNVLRHTVEDLDCEEAVGRPYQWHNFAADEIHDDEAARNRLRRQTHLNDVPDRNFTEVCIDYRMTGVGGYDSWGARPEPDCILWNSESYRYTIRLVPGKVKKALKTPY